MELTGQTIPPLTEEERTAKVFLGEGNFKDSEDTSEVYCRRCCEEIYIGEARQQPNAESHQAIHR